MEGLRTNIFRMEEYIPVARGGNNGGTREPGSQKETDLTESFLQFQEYILIPVEKIRTYPRKFLRNL